MLKHFPQGYVIEKEENVVVGNVTNSHQNTDTAHLGPIVLDQQTNTTTTARPLTEYRIFYRPK